MAEDPLAEFKGRILRHPLLLYVTVTFLVLTAVVAGLNQVFDLRTNLFRGSMATTTPSTPPDEAPAPREPAADPIHLTSLQPRISHPSEVLFVPQTVGTTTSDGGRASVHHEHSIAVTVADRLCLAMVTIDYDIPTGAKVFRTSVGYEVESSPNAEVRFQVFLDNVSAYDKLLRPFTTEIISLPLINVSRIRLFTFVTQCNRASGRAVWGDPRFTAT